MIVYCIENKLDGKKYIGITQQTIEDRYIKHLYTAKNIENCQYLHKAIRKYGKDNFHIYQIDEANTRHELFEKEKYWIQKLDTKNNGYNLTEGGEGCTGWKASEEQIKANIERNLKYYEEHPELKEHLSKKAKERWNSLSEEEQKKRKENFLKINRLTTGSKGKHWKLTEETKRKMSLSKKGYTMSDATKQKLSELAKKRTGRICSPETIEKMRQSALNRKSRKIGT